MTQSTAPLPSRHLHGLDDTAHTVRHTAYQTAHQELVDAVRNANAVAIHGPAGAGKTFAVHQFIRRINDNNPSIRTAWVEIPHRPRGKALPIRILRALHGTANDRLTEDQLLVDSVAALAERKTLLVIDEAHHLRCDGLFQIKHIFDQVNFGSHHSPPGHLGLALIGVDVTRTLRQDEQLASRVATAVEFRPLTGKSLLQVLDTYHRVFAETDERLLEELDDRYCHGSFRRWAQILQRTLNPLDGSDPPEQIDRRTTEQLLARMAN